MKTFNIGGDREPVRINGEMVLLARNRDGFTQAEVAEKAQISVGVLSRVEGGSLTQLPLDIVERIAAVLNVSPKFFDRDPKVRHYGFHRLYRLQRKLGAKALAQLEGELNARRLHLLHFLQSVELKPSLRMPERGAFEGYTPEQAAIELRRLWFVRRGPITNLTALLESAGILVVEVANADAAFHGLAVQAFGAFPIIFVRQEQPNDRRRFTLAHELAHLLLHQDPVDEQETDANRFASELLLPASDAPNVLRSLTLQQALQVKLEYQVSAQFVVMRAAQLGVIDSSHKQRLFKSISARGWRIDEPYAQPAEATTLSTEILATLTSQLGYSAAELAEELGEVPDRIKSLYFNNKPFPKHLGIVR